MPTRTLDEPSDLPPFDFEAEAADDDGEEVADAPEVVLVLVLELLLIDRATSMGITNELLSTLPRSTEPSELRTSGFAAKKEREYLNHKININTLVGGISNLQNILSHERLGPSGHLAHVQAGTPVGSLTVIRSLHGGGRSHCSYS